MYSVSAYGAMIADHVRTAAFIGALERVVGPGTVVAEIGTGPGVFAMIAAKLGARRVYAIESEPVIGLAKEIAGTNHLTDRITFIHGDARHVAIPEPADVIISDIGGVLPWFHLHLPTLIDARTRMLAPEGVLIPQRDTVSAAVVDAGRFFAARSPGLGDALDGLDITPMITQATSRLFGHRFAADALLSPACRVATLDYGTFFEADLDARIELTASRAGTANGLALWFDRVVASGIEIINAPSAPEYQADSKRLYGHAFFPWPGPVEMSPGDVVSVSLRASLAGDNYRWAWDTEIRTAPAARATRFCQSSPSSATGGSARNGELEETRRPGLSEDGEITRFGLALMRDDLSLGEIAERLRARFPHRFARRDDALSHVAALSREFA